MSDKQEQGVPYISFGSRLRRLREQVKESLAEVAGAVEIDVADLERFEKGQRRPTEDILELLVSHFSLHDVEAENLWKLAGYEAPPEDLDDDEPLVAKMSESSSTSTIVVMPIDFRIAYTDLSQIEANQQGIVINFMQSSGTGAKNKPMVISRVGMSKEQAAKLLEQIQESLKQIEPKALAAKNNRTRKSQPKKK